MQAASDDAKSMPPRSYLDKHVMPTLLNGLQQLVRSLTFFLLERSF